MEGYDSPSQPQAALLGHAASQWQRVFVLQPAAAVPRAHPACIYGELMG